MNRRLRGINRADAGFVVLVALCYLVATVASTSAHGLVPDRMMVVAVRLVKVQLDCPSFAGTIDSVLRDGRYYVAVGPLQVVPYLPFVLFPALQGVARYLVSLAFGLPAAWLALPLARAYGARGSTAYWVATFTALGTLLFFVSVAGDMYYLAHAESFLALELLLIEWAGRRRPAMLGLFFAISFLARPTTILAAVPFGMALLWRHRSWLREAVAFTAPIIVAGLFMAAFNLARFGSPLESGYAISILKEPSLIARRAQGVFSISQVPENIRLALLALPRVGRTFPFVHPDKHGLSMLLVSPGLLVALGAGLRERTQRLLWVAAGLIALPVFLYYGGGYVQYGFRYSLDFAPFLVALVALAAGRRFGRREKVLFVASMVSVTFGVIWSVNEFF